MYDWNQVSHLIGSQFRHPVMLPVLEAAAAPPKGASEARHQAGHTLIVTILCNGMYTEFTSGPGANAGVTLLQALSILASLP